MQTTKLVNTTIGDLNPTTGNPFGNLFNKVINFDFRNPKIKKFATLFIKLSFHPSYIIVLKKNFRYKDQTSKSASNLIFNLPLAYQNFRRRQDIIGVFWGEIIFYQKLFSRRDFSFRF